MAQPEIIQDDFAAGIVRSVARHLIPPNGVYDMVDLLLDDDGSAYKRAGTEYQSDANFGTGTLRWVWDGYLTGGRRTLFVDSGGDDLGMLDSDDESPVTVYSATAIADPAVAAQVGGVVFVAASSNTLAFAGSRKTANYSTGTVTVTADSATVTGAGTSWLANADAGILFQSAGVTIPVRSVDSDTQLTLDRPWPGSTAAGAAYAVKPVDGFHATVGGPTALASVGGRLAAASVTATSKVFFSPINDPLGTWNVTDDYHEFPGTILGLAAVRDTLIVFTTNGTYAVYNMAVDLTDAAGNPQQRIEIISQELVLRGQGATSWQGVLVVPALDGVWLLDPAGGAKLLSGSIAPLYRGYVQSGYTAGKAVVHRSHYFLPIVDSSYVVQDVLVCRLDRPGGYPWTRLGGHAADTAAYTVRTSSTGGAPVLLGATNLRVTKQNLFDPTAARKNDADGTTPAWQLTTRDYTLNSEYEGLVRRVLLRYEMIDAAADSPLISGYYSTGIEQAEGAEWGSAEWGVDDWSDASLAEFTLLTGTAPEDDGRDPYPFTVVAKARFLRTRFQSGDPSASAVIRSVRLLLDPMLKQR